MSTSEVTMNNGITRIQFDFNGIPDHNAWGLTPAGEVLSTDKSYRLPKNPTLLTEEEAIAQGAGTGTVGFALNGVSIFKPYNGDCCDAIWDELASVDYCLGHPVNGNYHYHFFSWGPEYDACPMSCRSDQVSDIMGIAFDGFPIYGPMQYYSESENKIYMDPNNGCSDCELILMNHQRDTCGGLEVADGDADAGTHYRYIVSNLFPYILQCWRGDMSLSQKYNSNNDVYRKITWTNKCGVNSSGDDTDGGTWSDTEYSWVGGTCDTFDIDWVTEHGCTPGNCPYSYQDFRMGEVDQHWQRAHSDTFSALYFECTAPPTTTTTVPATTTTADIDECTTGDDNCDQNATCTNTIGAFTCACNAGYNGDGATCEDINECSDDELNDCDDNANCDNSDGDYTCSCKDGYSGDGVTCEDIDECSDDELNDCDDNANCDNSDGDYSCSCKDGYSGDGVTCVDIDECADATLNDCNDNAVCVNKDGDYTCSCKDGYSGDGVTCEDIDECADAELINCDDNAVCTNNDGGFSCACAEGFQGDGNSCEEITVATTTTAAPTTTTEACEEVPMVWPGNAYNKLMFASYTKWLMRVNVIDKFADERGELYPTLDFNPCKLYNTKTEIHYLFSH